MQLTLWPEVNDKVFVFKDSLYLPAVICFIDGSRVTALIQSSNTWWYGDVKDVQYA